jgi:hypothetical protein
MEDIIKKIEGYQAEHKTRYEDAMKKPFNEIVFELAGIIGAYQSQLEMIKIHINIYKPLKP